MADDVLVTAGTGTTIATDDIGGRHFQRVKLAIGADGTAVDASSAAPVPAYAPDTQVAPTAIAALNAAVAIVLDGDAVVEIQATGTLSGTLIFEALSADDTTWQNIGVNVNNASAVFTYGSVPFYGRVSVSGFRQFRVRLSAYTSGTVNVSFNASAAAYIYPAPDVQQDGTTYADTRNAVQILGRTAGTGLGTMVKTPIVDTNGHFQVGQTPSTLHVTATGAAAAAVTLTLPAVAGQFHYITSVEITLFNTVARVGSATPVVVTSTNLPGTPAFTFPSAGAVGTIERYIVTPTTPRRSSVVNTATTIVGPATASVIWRINVSYYTTV